MWGRRHESSKQKHHRLKKQFSTSGVRLNSITHAWSERLKTYITSTQLFKRQEKIERKRCSGICHPSWSQIHQRWRLMIHCEPEWAALKQRESRSPLRRIPTLNGSRGVMYLRITVSVKVKTIAQNDVSDDLFNDLPCPSFPSFARSWPVSCFFEESALSSLSPPSHLLSQRSDECSEAGMCFRDPYSPTESQDKRRGQSRWLSEALLHPPASPTFSLPPPFSLPLSFWPAAGNLIRQGVS